MINIIVAKANNNAIGSKNTLIWHLPADLKYFRKLTTGNTVIMGRKTYDSIGKPLPNRRNIIITRNVDLMIDGCEVVNSLEAALTLSTSDEKVFIIGGADIYRQSMEFAHTLYVTEIHNEFEGDSYFPKIDSNKWIEVTREDHLKDEKNTLDYSFVIYNRK
ncbi:dihydrofolate reductase [Solitalea koreensis]|nr:dihydrofolate reductase [Solitalea koreensis]